MCITSVTLHGKCRCKHSKYINSNAPIAARKKGMLAEEMAPGSDVSTRSARLNRPSFSAVLSSFSCSSCGSARQEDARHDVSSSLDIVDHM